MHLIERTLNRQAAFHRKNHPQGIVAANHLVQRPLQNGHIHSPRQMNDNRNIRQASGLIRIMHHPHGLLRGGQRIKIHFRRGGNRRSFFRTLQQSCQLPDGGMFIQILQCQSRSKPRQRLCRQQRMTTQ